jgi:hypothetical protein
MKTISVLKDFSEFPGLRNCNISENSGEEFYHSILNNHFKEAFENKEKVIINLDRTAGYASSFLDQAFGSLVYDFTLINVKNYVEIISIQEPHWKEMIENQTYNQWELRRNKIEPPKVTIEHAPWYRLINDKLELSVWEHVAFA